MTWEVLEADCIEAMREMPEASVDAIVTDPPYHLTFMGRSWDHAPTPVESQRMHQAWATEALRVLKPGGHLLAFGGTRTYHRLACAVEDAGFEIRDSVIWLYGSGFPKSLAVDKAIDRARDDGAAIRQVTAFIVAHRNGKTNREMDDHFGFNGMAGHWTTQGDQAAVPTVPQWAELKSLLSLPDDMDAEVWRLNGRKGQPGENWEKREKVGEGPDYGHQRSATGYGFGDGFDLTAPATPEAQRWQGFGTALKPSHEPVVVARKPLIGTVAQNCLEFGTGALNIDGCRVAADYENEPGWGPGWLRSGGGGKAFSHDAAQGPAQHKEGSTVADRVNPAGRWPANVALSHLPECEPVGTRRVKGSGQHLPHHERSTPGGNSNTHGAMEGVTGADHVDPDGLETVTAWECATDEHGRNLCPVAELDRQSGELHSQDPATRGNQREGSFFGGASHFNTGGYGDTGGASRFFLTVPADTLCVLCGLPCVESVGNPSPPSTASSVIAPSDARAEPPRSDEGSEANSDSSATSAGLSSPITPGTDQTSGSTALPDAAMKHGVRIAHLAASVGRLCKSCETSTAQRVAQWLTDPIQASRAGLVSMPERIRQTLGRNLALIAAGWEKTGITPTTADLRASFGSAVDATESGIAEQGSDSSRFAYRAKSSRAERNAGLEGFERKPAGVHDDDAYVWPKNGDGSTRDKKVEPRANHHPTVKPIALMRWLCRLVTPPGGRLLDCFAGSGTTGIAAVLEGFDFIGIEREAEYVEIARARVAWWEQHRDRADEILALSAKSERERIEHEEAGQMGLEI